VRNKWIYNNFYCFITRQINKQTFIIQIQRHDFTYTMAATFFSLCCVASFYQFIIIIFISFVWRFLTYAIDVHSWVIRTTSTLRTVHFWETIVTILSTLHTHINTFVFKVVTIAAYTCPVLSHYWMHLVN
jgi:hypothetical protein